MVFTSYKTLQLHLREVADLEIKPLLPPEFYKGFARIVKLQGQTANDPLLAQQVDHQGLGVIASRPKAPPLAANRDFGD